MAKRKLFNPLHLEVIRLHWQGHSNVEIARKLGVHVNTVSKAINSEDGQDLLREARDRIVEEMVASFCNEVAVARSGHSGRGAAAAPVLARR